MLQCCTDCYQFCTPFFDCTDSFMVKVPTGYELETMTVQITKPGVNITINQELDVTGAGFVELDLTLLPSGYFNAYGGNYSMLLINPETGRLIEFTACDGNKYTSICFTFARMYSQTQESRITDVVINPFSC